MPGSVSSPSPTAPFPAMFVSFWLWWCLALSVCFLVHFQIPLSSANAELQDALEHKKRLIVLNKMDLANPNMMLVSSNGSLLFLVFFFFFLLYPSLQIS